MDATQLAALHAEVQQHIQQQVAAALAAMPAGAPVVVQPVLKPITPAPYSGDSADDVNTWLWSINKWLEAGHVTLDIEKITLTSGLLRGAALAWWRTREQIIPIPTTWADWQQELVSNFQPINPVETYRDQLKQLRQFTTVMAYSTAFRNIVVNIPTMTDEEKKFTYIYGLKYKVQEEVRMRSPTTFEEAVQLAIRFDMVHQRRPHYNNNNNNYNGPTPMELGTMSTFNNDNRQRSTFQGQRPYTNSKTNFKNNSKKGYFFGQRPKDNDHGPKLNTGLRSKLFKEGKCFHCQQTGHQWRNCPNRK